MKIQASIRLADLALASGLSPKTLQRRLLERGIPREGYRVMMVDLKEAWPSLYNSLLILAEEPRPACPDCGSPTHRTCTACDFIAA